MLYRHFIMCSALSHHLQCATKIGRQIFPFSRNAPFDARNISSEVILLKVKIDGDKLYYLPKLADILYIVVITCSIS